MSTLRTKISLITLVFIFTGKFSIAGIATTSGSTTIALIIASFEIPLLIEPVGKLTSRVLFDYSMLLFTDGILIMISSVEAKALFTCFTKLLMNSP